MILGKTKDSRTRRKHPISIDNAEKLKGQLKQQTELIDYLLLKGFSNSTVTSQTKVVVRFTKWLTKENTPVLEVTYNDILHYIQSRKVGLKQRTISMEINAIKHYYNFLSITNQVLENPTTQIQIKGIKRQTLYDILTSQELEKLFHDFKVDTRLKPLTVAVAKRNRMLLGLMIYQGLGTSELGNLKVEDLKLREGKVLIKGGRRSNDRTLKLEAHQVLDAMEYTLQVRQLLIDNKPDNKDIDSLFVSTGKGVGISNLLVKVMKIVRQQNNKVGSIKQIRASVITNWLKTYNLREVQYKAGHRYVSSTENYIINDFEDLQEDITKFHPIAESLRGHE